MQVCPIVTAGVLISLLPTAASVSPNLLTNGGFENGDGGISGAHPGVGK